jgi:hypothetical protein
MTKSVVPQDGRRKRQDIQQVLPSPTKVGTVIVSLRPPKLDGDSDGDGDKDGVCDELAQTTCIDHKYQQGDHSVDEEVS